MSVRGYKGIERDTEENMGVLRKPGKYVYRGTLEDVEENWRIQRNTGGYR